jgi:hypothetical protein
MILFRIVWRLIVMQIGLALAVAAAAGAIVGGFDLLSQVPAELGFDPFGPRRGYGDPRPVQVLVFGSVFAVVMSQAQPAAFLAALLAELLSIRHLFYFLVAGAGVGAWGFLEPNGRFGRMPTDPAVIAPFVAAGFVGGFVYWLVAGRGAGFRRASAPAAAAPSPTRAAPPPPPVPPEPSHTAPAGPGGALARIGWGRPSASRTVPPPGDAPVPGGRLPHVKRPMPPTPPHKPVVERRPR